MINPSTAPTSPNPMPAGLGALTQMAPTPRGKSPSNMGQIMELARSMSDAQLADVLQGKSLDVPQFAAMTEAMGRKSLRNAVQGMEAQGQAHQPSLKDRMLAEDAAQQMPEASGIGQIPAPNMESMDMAGGGIIAFDRGGDIETRRKEAFDVINQNMPEKAPSGLDMSLTDYYNFRNKALRAIDTNMPLPVSKESMEARQSTYGNKFAPPPVKDNTPSLESGFTATPSLAITPLVEDTSKAEAKTNPNLGALLNRSAGVANPMGPKAAVGNVDGGTDAEIAKYVDKYRSMFGETPALTKRANPFADVKYEGDSADKTKEQGMGYGLMQAGAALLKNPTFAGGLGDAMTAFGNQGWITAKEIKAAKKDERDFNKDMAKANELFEQGQEEKAYKYAALAQDKEDKIRNLALNTVKANTEKFVALANDKYHMGSLDVQRMQASRPDSGMALLNRVLSENKGMSTVDALSAISGAKNPRLSTISPEFALNQYNDVVKNDMTGKFKKQFPTPGSYYNSLQQSSAPQPRFLGFE
jgi:hypothetical protein